MDEEGIKAAGKVGMIPEDGFDEDEDCVNVEDETYRDYLNSITGSGSDKMSHMVYRDGELVSVYTTVCTYMCVLCVYCIVYIWCIVYMCVLIYSPRQMFQLACCNELVRLCTLLGSSVAHIV